MANEENSVLNFITKFSVDQASLNMSKRALSDYQKTLNDILYQNPGTQVSGSPTFTPTGKGAFTFAQPVTGPTGKSGVFAGSMVSIGGQYQADSVKFVKASKDMEEAANKQGGALNNLGANYAKLAIRAALVIPIWQALRMVYTQLWDVIAQGIERITTLDKTLGIIRGLMVGEGGDIEAVIRKVGESAKSLAVETGVGVSEAAEAFRNFKDAGIDATASMAGMNTSVRLAVALNGDLAETSRTLADMYNLMGDSITGAITPQEKMNKIAGNVAVLSQTNTFRLGEFNEGLKNFAASAKNFGLSLDEMMGLLAVSHTFMLRAGASGTLLTRVFIELGKNTKLMNTYLEGTGINLQSATYFEKLMVVIKKLNSEIKNGTKTSQEIFDLFDIRAGKAVGGMVSNFDRLIEEMDRLKTLGPKGLEIMNEMAEDNINTVSRQTEIFKNLKGAIGEAFLEGITGTKDFTTSLKEINKLMQDLIPVAETLGSVIKGALYIPALALSGWGKLIKEAKFQIDESERRRIAKGGKTTQIQNPQLSTDQYTEFLKGTKLIDEETQKRHELEKIVVRTAAVEQDINNTTAGRIQNLDRLKMYGIDEIEIERRHLKYLTDSKEIIDQQLKIQKLINDEVIKEADVLQNSLQSSFKNLMTGKGGIGSIFSDLNKSMVDNYQNIVSEGFSNMIMASGIGEIFGGAFSNLKGMFGGLTGKIESAYEKGGSIGGGGTGTGGAPLTNSFYGAGGTGMSSATFFHRGGIAVGSPSGGITGKIESAHEKGGSIVAMKIIAAFQSIQIRGAGGSAIAGYGGGAYTGTSYVDSSGGIAVGSPSGGITMPFGYAGVGTQRGGVLVTPPKGFKSGPSGAQIGGAGVTSAMLGYSQYQSARAGGKSPGMSAASGLMTGIGSMGLMLGVGFGGVGAAMAGGAGLMAGLAAIGPLGWIGIGLMVGGMALGMFGGKKSSQTTSSSQTSESKVSSKIDVTNKNLEIINRNLIALRTDIRTYILPASAYFAEKRNLLEDQFSINSRRGIIS